MPVKAVYTFDPAEHAQATREIWRYTSARRFAWVLVPIMALMVANIVYEGWGEVPAVSIVVNALPYVIILALWLMFGSFALAWLARRVAAQDRSLQGVQERTVDETGYHHRGDGVVFEMAWRTMVRAVESERFFFFFSTSQAAFYVPKRVLPAQQVEEVRALIRRHLGNRGRLLAGRAARGTGSSGM